MKISIVIPVYNGARYLCQCIDSVLEQDESIEKEIILIDDNSTDKLSTVINYLKKENKLNDKNFIYIKNEENKGPAESRNIGVERATGDYIAFLDVDDWWDKDKLKKQIEVIEKNNSVLVYTSRTNFFEEDGRTKDLIVPERITYEELLRGNQIACSSVLIKKDVAKKYKMTNPEIHEDYYLWLRILKDYDHADGINEPLLKYRVHSGSKSRNKIKSAIMTFQTIRKVGVPFIKACFCFMSYMTAGIKKYN